MERAEIIEKLKVLIEDQNDIRIESSGQELDIDSYTMMLIITYVQEELGVQLDMEELDFDAFKSLEVFADLVQRESAKSAA